MKDVLFEIGTEEIPSRFMPDIMEQLRKNTLALLDEYRLGYRKIQVFGTPRRMTVLLIRMTESQEDLVKSVRGPSASVAFDADGNPTKAGAGFSRSQGIDPSALVVEPVDGTDYVFAPVRREGLPSREVLPEMFERLIESLQFPKNMRWGDADTVFVRPVRWLVSLYGEEVLPFSWAGVTAGRTTRGHRTLAPGDIEITSPGTYLEQLEKAYVICDQEQRKALILADILRLVSDHDGVLQMDEGLLTEVAWLVEYPTAFVGHFSSRYLSIPKEALITPMKAHQKYFPVTNSDGELLPLFLGVRNGDAQGLDNVARGNEKVLLARLEDAKFFYEEDLKTPLEEMTQTLDRVVFQEKLGSYGDKVRRIETLARFIGDQLGYGDAMESIGQCARLCKADLSSHMVYEFPELQGIMGEYYALAQGLAPEVAQGIREHYQPRFYGDQVPRSLPGICVSIADKIDSITGIYGVGMKPTGSQDPYALRRAAQGIVNTVVENRLPLDMGPVLEKALQLHGDGLIHKDPAEIRGFFRMRLKNHLEEAGYRYDLVDAILSVSSLAFFDTVRGAKALKSFSRSDGFDALVTGVTRAANLCSKSPQVPFDRGLLVDEAETRLADALDRSERKVHGQLAEQDYLGALKTISGLREDIDHYLDNTMVMVDDVALRNNRLALLDRVVSLVAPMADLSKVVHK